MEPQEINSQLIGACHANRDRVPRFLNESLAIELVCTLRCRQHRFVTCDVEAAASGARS